MGLSVLEKDGFIVAVEEDGFNITIESLETSFCPDQMEISILEKDGAIIRVKFLGGCFYLNQEVIAKSSAFPWLLFGRKGKIVRFHRPYEEGRGRDIIDVLVGDRIFYLELKEVFPC